MQRAVWLLFLGFAVGMFGAIFLSAASARAASPTIQVAIYVDTTGNSDNALGPTDTCNSTPLQVGDTIDIDVVVRGVPAFVPGTTTTPPRDGIAAFGFNLLFDPTVLQVNDVLAYDGPTILKAADNPIPVAILDYDGHSSPDQDPPPGRSGNVRVDMINLGYNFAKGDGVLTRITLQAVGTGTSRLDFEDTPLDTTLPRVWSGGNELYGVTKSPAALVVVGGSCANPTPSPFPTPTRVPGTFTPGPSPSVTPLLRNTITFEPSTIPVNQDSVITLSATAESPGIANFAITVKLGDGVGYVSCSTQTAATCFAHDPFVDFGNATDKSHIGAFTIGQLTVHPTGPAGKTSAQFRGCSGSGYQLQSPHRYDRKRHRDYGRRNADSNASADSDGNAAVA